MYRFFALALVFGAVACGGGGAASETPTTEPTAGAVQTVAGERTTPPAVTPSATATPPGTYEVADGDTLWDIAVRFNTTVEAIVAVNELTNADELTVGQVLKISAAAVATSTPAATATPQ